MAAPTLSVLTHPHFPQVFEDAVSFEVRRVSRMVDQALGRCSFEVESYSGACDGQPCGRTATEGEFCARHAEEVSRG